MQMKRFAVAAFAWALAFGLLSMYWALGGMIGADQLSPSLREQAERRELSFIAILWVTAVVKVIGGLVPLALAFDLWLTIPRRVVSMLTWLGGVCLTLYGLGDMFGAVLMLNGVMGNRDDSTVWYLVLWGPIWLVGGVLFLGTAWCHQRERKTFLA